MHIIRLRGPWQKHRDDDPPVRVQVPDADRDAVPNVCYRRRFNRPTGLGPQDRVFLRITDWEGNADSIQINGNRLTVSAPPLAADITSGLLDHNEISVHLVVDSQAATPPRLSGEVSLEIVAPVSDANR